VAGEIGRARGSGWRSAVPRSVLVGLALLQLAGPALSSELTPARAFRTFDRRSHRGLPQSTVNGLYQDESGLLYMTTMAGLAVYDGVSLETVRDPDGPGSQVLSDIAGRKAGGFYVAGSAPEVLLFDGVGWSRIPSARPVAALAEDGAGRLFAADVEGALAVLDSPSTSTAWRKLSLPGLRGPIVSLAACAGGGVLVADRDAVVSMRDGVVTRLGGAVPGPVECVLCARDGTAWIGTGTGELARAEGTSGTDATWRREGTFAGGPVRRLAEDRRGRIWAGGERGSLGFAAGGAFTLWGPENGVQRAAIRALLPDREGTLWLGFNGRGLQQWLGEGWSHRPNDDGPDGIPRRVAVFALAPTSDGGFLAALFESGVWRWDGRRLRRFGAGDGLTEDVRAVVEPEPGTIWAGTRNGIFESKGGGRFTRALALPTGFVNVFAKDPRGVWLAGTSTFGLYERVGGSWRPAETLSRALPSRNVRSLATTRAGELWVGTASGVTIFRGDETETLAGRANGVPDAVHAILEVEPGVVWLGGTGGIGIRGPGKPRFLGPDDGTPGTVVYSLILSRAGDVWAGGGDGVARFSAGRASRFDSRNGLLEDECNLGGLLEAPDGSILVGTMGSLARFDPSVVPLPAPELRCAFRSGVDRHGVARLPASDRTLRLSWRAPWLTPEPVEYRSRVPRLSLAWSAAQETGDLRIENLGPGLWEVEVEARLRGGPWTAPITASVEIGFRWWETPWARIAALLVVLGGLWGAVAYRTRSLSSHAAELDAEVGRRTAELAEKAAALARNAEELRRSESIALESERRALESERRARESEREAVEASKAKSSFLANVSHELRTPLNAIIGYSELLSEEVDPRFQEDLDRIQKAGKHLLGLIDSVLDLSKIEAGKMDLHLEELDLRPLVLEIESIARPIVEKKRNVFEVVMPEEPVTMFSDITKIKQMALNLLANAAKFTEGGRVVLRVGLAEEMGKSWVVFAVEDTGIGMTSSQLEKVFVPFTQGDASTTRKYGGTGLGLALTKRFCELMGGEVSAVSAPGRGSTLTLRLPRRVDRRRLGPISGFLPISRLGE